MYFSFKISLLLWVSSMKYDHWRAVLRQVNDKSFFFKEFQKYLIINTKPLVNNNNTQV